jgi:hypothetical protein
MGRSIARRLLGLLPESRRSGLHGFAACLRATGAGWRLDAQRIEGHGAEGEALSLRAFGPVETHEYFLDRVYPAGYSRNLTGTCDLPSILRNRAAFPKADIILCPVNPWTAGLFERKGWSVLLGWVDCCLTLKPDADATREVISRSLKRDLRAAGGMDYSIQVTGDDCDIRWFYNRMHEPAMRIRHEEEVIKSNMETIRALLVRGRLIKVYLDGEWVAGGAVVHRPGELWAAKIGWLDGRLELLHGPTISVLYQAVIKYAESAGYRRVNFGACRGYADDGVLLYKMKWRTRPEIRRFQYSGNELWGPLYDMCAARFNIECKAVRSVLQAHPMLARAGKRLQALTFDRERPPVFDHLGDSLLWNDLGATGSCL